MKFDFDHGVNRKGTYSMKYDDPEYFRRLAPGIRLDEGTIRLMLADMDFPCADPILEALHKRIDRQILGYSIYENDEFTVNCFMLRHTKICYGYSLVEKQRAGAFSVEAALSHRVPRGPLWSKLQHGLSVMNEDGLTVTPDMVLGPKRDGRKFTYITDTMYFPELSDYAHDSDILFCEGMFDSSLEDDARQKKHMTAAQAAMVARDGNVARLCLQHYSPRYSDRELKTLAAEARAIFPETVLTRDRMSFEIPLKD